MRSRKDIDVLETASWKVGDAVTTVTDLAVDYDEWRRRQKPDGISACIRLRNESQFMRAAIRSIVDLVDEVVLVVQPSDDPTLAIADAFAHQDPKIKVYEYPLVPDWIDTPGFYSKDPDAPGHMVHMSNWALSKCTYKWILKVEGDVIALPTLKWMIEHAVQASWPMYYGLVILNVAGKNMDQISWENPRNGGWDEAIFPNDPDLVRFMRRGKWEVAVPTGLQSTCLGWALLHMKRCKTGKDQAWNGEHYVPWERDVVREALTNYNSVNPYPGPDDPFGGHVLFRDEWKQFL